MYRTLIVSLCVLIQMIDGADILSMAFTAPAVAREWSLGPTEVGLLLSSSLVGLTAGSFLLSPLADVIGRRTTMLVCIAVTGGAMLASSYASSFGELAALRILTGLGVGGLSTTISIMAVEFALPARRNLAVGMVTVGFPLGAMLGAIIAAYLLGHWGWRSVFLTSGFATILILPVVYFVMPESLDYLLSRRPRGALQRINPIRRKLRLDDLTELPPLAEKTAGPIVEVLRRPIRTKTFLACATYFTFMMSYYFIASWIPKLISDLRFSDSSGALISALMSFGGIGGALVVGLVGTWYSIRWPTVFFLMLVAGLIAGFGNLAPYLELHWIGFIAAVLGFAVFATAVGTYSVMVQSFPPQVRGTGTGVAFGMGRFGAALGPYAGGYLLQGGLSGAATCTLLALPALLSAVFFERLSRHSLATS